MVDEATQEAQTEKVVIQISLTPDGQVRFQSSLMADKIALYGLLELAKDLVREAHAPKALRPQGNFLQGLRANGKH